jgi:hypothetical protein
MSLTISLDALGGCLAGISMILLFFTAQSYFWRRSLQPFAVAAFASHNRLGVNFY